MNLFADSGGTNPVWTLSPSDFAFLWEECKRCFYLKVARNLRRPSAPMPRIFTRIDAQMKARYSGKRTHEVMSFLPAGVIQCDDSWVQSAPLALPGYPSACVLRGKLDTVVRFDDGTFAVVDFKTSQPRDAHVPLYGRQLHAYAWALENAAPGNLALKPVRRLGLLVFEPARFLSEPAGPASLSGALTWLEIPRNDKAFEGFLVDVAKLLARPEPPAAAANCEWCNYRDASRRTRL